MAFKDNGTLLPTLAQGAENVFLNSSATPQRMNTTTVSYGASGVLNEELVMMVEPKTLFGVGSSLASRSSTLPSLRISLPG